MSMRLTTSIRSIVISCVLAIIILGGVVAGLTPVEATGLFSPLAYYVHRPADYGVVYLYPFAASAWDPGDVDDMEDVLLDARDMGLTVVIQPFPSALVGSGDEERWNLFLDEAQAVGIDVVAYLWPDYNFTGDPDDPFDYSYLKPFLDEVGDHPALRGYIGLHEPLEEGKGISDDELRSFYTEMTSYAPGIELAHYMGDIAYWEDRRSSSDGWTFSDGMCDICIIWYYPFRYVGGAPVFEEDLVPPVVQSNLELVRARDPDAVLWFLGQSFTQSTHWRDLRMPTSDEMKALFRLVMQEPLDGYMWYPWNHTDVFDDVLSDPGMEDQQEMVSEIADEYLHHRKSSLPVVLKD
jgi:hypothetical protein